MADTSKLTHEMEATIVYELDGITYVPHYVNRKYYVGPGYGTHNHNLYSVDQLEAAGAKPRTIMLWARPKHLERIPTGVA